MQYHVTKDSASPGRKALRAGADRATGIYRTHVGAEKAAKRFAAASGGGEVRIHTPKGQIRDSDTIAPARDSYPPRDKKH